MLNPTGSGKYWNKTHTRAIIKAVPARPPNKLALVGNRGRFVAESDELIEGSIEIFPG
jgi:hypothetical protein